MNAHDSNTLFRAVKAMVAPLDKLEAEARKIWPHGAAHGSLFVLYRVPYGAIEVPAFDPSPTYSYQWGDAEISRDDAVHKLGAA